MKTSTLFKNYIHRSRGPSLLCVSLVIGCFAISQMAQAVTPAPDGGYPGGNTVEGQSALFGLTTGSFNTAVGYLSLRSDTTGSFNTAIGAGTLFANNAAENTAIGLGALFSHSTGNGNTANGAFALFSDTGGFFNTANGFQALFSSTTGDGNTATGVGALFHNTTGFNNTASGGSALAFNTTGADNTAIGDSALINNTTGNSNMALGVDAGSNVTTASNVICIGGAGANVSNSCFIGNIRGVTTINNNAIPVLVDSNNQVGTISSSRRFKKEIKPMDKASEVILALKPVTFHYKSDKTNRPEFGLIAEEVAEVNPALVVRDQKGEIYTVRYDAVNAMLLNEFLKEHRKVEEQQATITQLKLTVAQQGKDFQATVAQLTARLDEQASQIQKVNAQLEASKPAQQVVNNP